MRSSRPYPKTSLWTSALEAELEDVFVVNEARRRGVGRRLVEFAIAHALARGCRAIGLNTNERNIGALAYTGSAALSPSTSDGREAASFGW
jgi:GNAT superfamily N-acetyltransferase